MFDLSRMCSMSSYQKICTYIVACDALPHSQQLVPRSEENIYFEGNGAYYQRNVLDD